MVEYGSCLLSAINDAILLYTVVAMGPISPAVENTKGEKDPCSISLTETSDRDYFSIQYLRTQVEKDEEKLT